MLCGTYRFFPLSSFRRSPISVAAAAIYMASQASDEKRSQKGFWYIIIYVRLWISSKLDFALLSGSFTCEIYLVILILPQTFCARSPNKNKIYDKKEKGDTVIRSINCKLSSEPDWMSVVQVFAIQLWGHLCCALVLTTAAECLRLPRHSLRARSFEILIKLWF